MANKNIGSSFESWLDEAGIYEEVSAAAIKQGLARQIAEEMAALNITKSQMAQRMDTSRAQVDRLLDPENGSVTLATLLKVGEIIGRALRVEYVDPSPVTYRNVVAVKAVREPSPKKSRVMTKKQVAKKVRVSSTKK